MTARVILAPMEGLADWLLRDVLTQVGGYDAAVSEFVRVSGPKMPLRSFRRVSPELDHGGRTPSGVPVDVQLLGSDPDDLADNAAQLARLSPPGIDLNFGCPVPQVNRHGAGAALLDDPARIGRIVAAVRQAVPAVIPVSAKMRLGIRDTARALDCARAIAAGGASRLVVHARTRDAFYRPPAHWEWVAYIREAVAIPVIANGEVWTLDDYLRCRAVTGCSAVMLGRGAVADPFLARRIRAFLDGTPEGACEPDSMNSTNLTNPTSCANCADCADWAALRALLAQYWWRLPEKVLPCHAPGRLKMWLKLLCRRFPEAEALYQAVRPLPDAASVTAVLARHHIGEG